MGTAGSRARLGISRWRDRSTVPSGFTACLQIRRERNEYYEILERTQKDTLDVTPWMEWFLACLGRAIDGAQTTLAAVLRKARFWQTVRDVPINDRQRVVLNRVLDGFEGNLSTSKWATIAKCSPDTALRDILDLVGHGVLVRNPGAGRSTSYSLAKARYAAVAPGSHFARALRRDKGPLVAPERSERRVLHALPSIELRSEVRMRLWHGLRRCRRASMPRAPERDRLGLPTDARARGVRR